jgi:hypothetical protein
MKLTRWFFILCVLPLVHPWVLGQQQERPVVVSRFIGDTLDVGERETYKLLPNLQGFEWTVFYLNPDSSLKVKVSLVQNGVRRDTVIARYRTYMAVQNQIHRFAEGPGESEKATVRISLNNGQEIEGELISVRDSSVLIATEDEDVPSVLSTGVNGIIAIKDTMISRVTIEGSSHVLAGMCVGLVGGVVIGGVIAASQPEPSPPPSGNLAQGFGEAFGEAFAEGVARGAVLLAGAVGGTLVGAAVGAAKSKRDVEVNLDVPAERSALKKLARYPDKEPKAFQVIK